MEHVSRRVQSLSVSQTLAMAQKRRELKEQGIDVMRLSIGEPDFTSAWLAGKDLGPDEAIALAKSALDEAPGPA